MSSGKGDRSSGESQGSSKAGSRRGSRRDDDEDSSQYESVASTLPYESEAVKRRLRYLEKLQGDAAKVEGDFRAEMHRLERQYRGRMETINSRRAAVISGSYEPTEEEGGKMPEAAEAKAVVGVPSFWLTIFKNAYMVADMVKAHDAPALAFLKDVTSAELGDRKGFMLSFHFAPNDFFNNGTLLKSYYYKSSSSAGDPQEDRPLDYEERSIYRAKGCKIGWKQGKNLTLKNGGEGPTGTQEEESFFGFFDPPPYARDAPELDEETKRRLMRDFDVGYFIRRRVIDQAILYFIGEMGKKEKEEFVDARAMKDSDSGEEELEYDDADSEPMKT